MKTKTTNFHSKISKLFILTLVLMLFAGKCFSQWKTSVADNIRNDVVISYEVVYENELSEEQKKSSEFLSEIIVTFNKDKLIERKLGHSSRISNNYTLCDYNNLKSYTCFASPQIKNAMQFDFEDPKLVVEPIVEPEPKMIFEFPCEKASVMLKNKPREMFYTKKIGLKFCKQFKIDGFLLSYPGHNKTLGHYTVNAKKITYLRLDQSYYSLDDFKIQTEAQLKKDVLEREETMKAIRMKFIGEKACVVNDLSIENEKINTKKFSDEVIVYNFWFTTCAPCKKEIPNLNALKEKYKDKNVHFVAIALDPEYLIKNFLKTTPFKYDIIAEGRSIAQKFDINAYPTNIVVDKKGIIQFYEIGYKSDISERMANSIDESLSK